MAAKEHVWENCGCADEACDTELCLICGSTSDDFTLECAW